jgi:hypothetical protein
MDYAYCVYVHSVDGKPFYVGQGTIGRAFTMDNRTTAWKEKVGGKPITVRVVSFHKDKNEALAVESALIKELETTDVNKRYRGSEKLEIKGTILEKGY